MVAAGKEELRLAKLRFDHEECVFCFDYEHNSGEPLFKKFDKEELGKNYFKKYMDHMRSHQHLNNVVKFRKNLKLALENDV
jgi:hypothetical protein